MWKFFEHEPGRVIHDPIESAFFSNDKDEETARHLIRESIQNSLDARRGQETVRVRFTFGELDARFAISLFNGRRPISNRRTAG